MLPRFKMVQVSQRPGQNKFRRCGEEVRAKSNLRVTHPRSPDLVDRDIGSCLMHDLVQGVVTDSITVLRS
jgi:hypothetical protein